MNNKLHTILSFLLALTLFTAGCTLDNITDTSRDAVTEDDLLAASQILGESLSGANSGVVLSMSDALAILAQSNINTNVAYSVMFKDPIVEDIMRNYMHVYDPDTGIHTVSFLREVENPFFSKSVTDTLKYIYRDEKGNLIEFPRERRERIASVNYTGWRQGTLSTLHKESEFTRKDTLLVAGFSDNTSELTIEGVHYGAGSITIDRANKSPVERSYKLKITLLDIDIGKSVLSNTQKVATEVKGTLSWELQYTGGAQKGTNMRGTIKLNGDGTALLRFQSSPALYQINLTNGDIKNLDEAFAGRVSSVDISSQRLTLVSGLNVYLLESSAIEGSTYASLQAVQEAINNNIPIWAEGEGGFQNNRFKITKIAFVRENDEVANKERIAFEEPVTAVNREARTFTIAGQVSIQVTDKTIIDQQGDYSSLQEVLEALGKKEAVKAEGVVMISPDGLNQVIAAKVVFNHSAN